MNVPYAKVQHRSVESKIRHEWAPGVVAGLGLCRRLIPFQFEAGGGIGTAFSSLLHVSTLP